MMHDEAIARRVVARFIQAKPYVKDKETNRFKLERGAVGYELPWEAFRSEDHKIDFELDAQGLIIKADTIGSLEALIKESREKPPFNI